MNATPEMRLLQLNTIVMNRLFPLDWTSMPVYLFSETSDNVQSVLEVGKQCLYYGGGPVCIIDDADKTNDGYPGASVWKESLEKCRIITLTPGASLNTLTESLAVAAVAKEEKWDSLVIIAPPFHQLRAFISMVTAVSTVGYPTVRIYNKVGVTLPWYAQARHSQGTLTAKRSDLILTEAERILKYQQEGTPVPLLSTERVLEYLEWRDT